MTKKIVKVRKFLNYRIIQIFHNIHHLRKVIRKDLNKNQGFMPFYCIDRILQNLNFKTFNINFYKINILK